MPSFTSSFKPSDAAPVYQRDLPALAIGRAWIIAAVFFVLTLSAWEVKWRAYGAQPTYQNSDGAWAIERRRIADEKDATVLLGSSRVLFDVQLAMWERILGRRPIQLALEGTSPLPALEDLAADPHFTGRTLVGISPPLFAMGMNRREAAVKNWKRETHSQRAGQWLSMNAIEPFFAFYEPDFALVPFLKRQEWWPRRRGVFTYKDVRRLSTQGRDRNTRLWDKLEKDAAYRELAKSIWRQIFAPPPGITREMAQRTEQEQLERAAAAVTKLRQRGAEVIFLRAPSDGEFLAAENGGFPRARTWNSILEKTGAPGIHFQDYPELRGFTPVEWSHLSGADADRFTEALCGILARDYGWAPATRKD